MKILLIATAALACATLVPVSKAQAEHPGEIRHTSNCGACGGASYHGFIQVGYDYRGCPAYNWVPVPHTCQRVCAPHHSSHRHVSHRKQSSHRHGNHNHSSKRKKDQCRR